MTQAGKAVIDQQDETEAGASEDDLGAPFSLSALRGGAWGPSATNKRHRIYTCALLATTISTTNGACVLVTFVLY